MKQWTYILLAISLLAACNTESGTADIETAGTTQNNDGTSRTEKFVFPGEKGSEFATTYEVNWVEPKDLSPEMTAALKEYYDVSMRTVNDQLVGVAAKADSFFAEYAVFKESSSEFGAPAWEHVETYTVVPSADNVLTINKFTRESKAAQTIINTEYLNFDKRFGNLIPLNKIVSDTLVDSLNSIAETYFVQQNNVDLSQGWVNAGYNLYSGFHTNQNFILGKDSITFVYNPYEIADFSKGIIRFSVPNSAIKPIAADLSDQWLQ